MKSRQKFLHAGELHQAKTMHGMSMKNSRNPTTTKTNENTEATKEGKQSNGSFDLEGKTPSSLVACSS